MLDELTTIETADAKVINFVSTALRQDKLSGLSETLRVIAEAVDAYGCILWQVTPGSQLDANNPQGTLFVLAQWLTDDRFVALYNLSLESVSGKAVLTQKSINVAHVLNEPPNITSFLEETRINTMCSVPVTFLDGTKGTVNVYRTNSRPFTEEELNLVEQLASVVPALYHTIRDRVSLNLIRSIDEIINKAEVRSKTRPLSLSNTKQVFAEMCQQIATTFDCIETSLFLRVDDETPKQYKLVATTWPVLYKKRSYRSNSTEGITGWVLWKRKPVKIFDLANFERDKKEITNSYPNLVWRDSLDINRSARELLRLPKKANLPPLSFMAVPILVGSELLGVIRCSTSKGGPYYFADRELDLLMLVAAQIGRYTSNWLSRRRMQRENETWRALVRSVSSLNRFVQTELGRDMPDELRIFDEVLRLAETVIPEAEIMDVRLVDSQTNELYFAQTRGSAWNQGTETEIEKRRRRRFSLEVPASAGAHVFRTAQLYVVNDADTDPFYSKTFPSTKRMIIAPISVGNETFGVLDIRATTGSQFPSNAEAIAELLGQQLGLYYYLTAVIQRLRTAEAELKNHVVALKKLHNEQAQTFEDLEHQFKSPIGQAYSRIESVLKELPDDRLRAKVLAIRGLCGKARRVTMSTGLFAQLAQEKSIEPRLRPLHYDDLVRLLIEAAADAQLIMDPGRGVHFRVDRHSPDVFRTIQVNIDYDLLGQSINNLLDNASKYSFRESSVDIFWGLTATERFHITVCNVGIPFYAKDLPYAVRRGWRGEMARSVTGEGSGIGLWIVDHIMRAHGGELLVNPTNRRGLTQVRLVFPVLHLR